MTGTDVTPSTENDVIKLLKEQLQSLEGTEPEDHQARIAIAERIRQFEREDREFRFKESEQRSSTKQWRSNTPLVIALTGLLTIAANFGVSYILKDQGSNQERQLAETNATLTSENQKLNSQLRDSEASRAQERANETKGLEFQYNMIDKIMSAPSDPDLNDEQIEQLRARQIAFLYKMGLMSKIEKEGFKRLYKSATNKDLDDADIIGFPTLPTAAQPRNSAIGSRLTAASKEEVERILGPSGTANCEVPLVEVTVPFEFVDYNGEKKTASKVRVHKAAVKHFEQAFQLIVERKLEKEIRQVGAAYRYMKINEKNWRGIHAWGASIDFNPPHSFLERKTKRVSIAFAQAMEDAGFLSIGLKVDGNWSHFELSQQALEDIERGGYKPPARECETPE